MLTFGGHLDVLRKLLFRVAAVTLAFAAVIFIFKGPTFDMLLGPSEWDFCTYKWIQSFMRLFDSKFSFEEFHIDLIATELSSQFMTHISTAIYLGLLCASPYVLYELFRFVSPALYTNERRYATRIIAVVYLLFIAGVMMSYFILFPISFRFLGTYNVDPRVTSTITLDSYISTFVTLTLLMGLVFQLPVITYTLGKFGLVNAAMLARYRKHAVIVILLVAAIITPPDLMTLVLVAVPLYLLYEAGIRLLRVVKPKT